MKVTQSIEILFPGHGGQRKAGAGPRGIDSDQLALMVKWSLALETRVKVLTHSRGPVAWPLVTSSASCSLLSGHPGLISPCALSQLGLARVAPTACSTHCLQHPPLSSSSGSCSASDASLITTSLEQSSRLCCFDQVLSSASPHALFCLYKLACECVFGVYLLPDSRLRRGGTTISPAPKGEGIPEMVGR